MTSIAELKAKYEQAIADGTPIKPFDFNAFKDRTRQMIDDTNLSDSDKTNLIQEHKAAISRPSKWDTIRRNNVQIEDYWTMMKRERDERLEWLRLHPNEAMSSNESEEQIDWDKLKFPNGPMPIPKALYEKMKSVFNSVEESTDEQNGINENDHSK